MEWIYMEDYFFLPEWKFSRENGISWKADQNCQTEFPNRKCACHLLVFEARSKTSNRHGKSRENGTSASLWKFPFGIWRVPFSTTIYSPTSVHSLATAKSHDIWQWNCSREKCLAANIAKSMMSEDNGAALPTKVNRRSQIHINSFMHSLCYVTNNLITGSSGSQLILFP